MDKDDHKELLIRIDERTKSIIERMDHFVTRHEFKPIRRVVYGLVGAMLIGVTTSLIRLVLP